MLLGKDKVEKEVVTMIGDVAVDASLSESHSMSGTATEHPVETGSPISDHYRLNARTVKIDGIITNQPLDVPRSQADGVKTEDKEFSWEAYPDILGVQLAGGGLLGAAAGAVMSAAGVNKQTGKAKGFSREFDRAQDAYDQFEFMRDKREPISIYTTLRVYHDMVIESFDVIRDKTSIDCLRFSCTAKQIRVTSTAVVAAPKPTVERGKKKKVDGKKSTSKAGSDVVPTEKLKSAAKALLG